MINLKDFYKKVGTPSYLFDIDAFSRRAEHVKAVFGERVGICFSIKANPFLLYDLPDVFDKIEVCSPGELTVCEKTGIDMSKVIFSGVNKTYTDVERAARDKVGVFTAESRLHLDLVNRIALSESKVFDVLLRIADNTQFGMDESEVLDIIENRSGFEGVNIVGVHYFTGTGKRKAKSIIKEVDYLSDFVDRVKSVLGFVIERVEYGTGLAVDYFSKDGDAAELARLEEIAPAIRQLSQKAELTVEMGRFFAACCGYYFTKVIDTKTNGGINYMICDGGLNHLKYDGQLQGMQLPEIVHIEKDDSVSCEPWTVCGSLCTTADVLARGAEFCGLKTGDTLVFCKTGAYSACEGMALFLSRELPSVYVYSEKDGLQKLRDVKDASLFNTPKEM